MSDTIELSKIKKNDGGQSPEGEGRVYEIKVTGRIPAEMDIVILRDKK